MRNGKHPEAFPRNLLHAINLKGLYALRFFGYVKVFFGKLQGVCPALIGSC